MQEIPGPPIAVSRCLFIDGQHVYAGPDCDHDRTHDEMGEVKPRGWTVQQ